MSLWKRKELAWISKAGRHCESKLLEVAGMGELIPAKTSIMTDASSCVSMTFGERMCSWRYKIGRSVNTLKGGGKWSDLIQWGAWVNTWINKTKTKPWDSRRKGKGKQRKTLCRPRIHFGHRLFSNSSQVRCQSQTSWMNVCSLVH